MNITVTSTPSPRPEGGIRYYTDVYNDQGTHVLESIHDELDDAIVLTSGYAKLGEMRKGYGTAAFTHPSGPLALSISTGKPMVIINLSYEGAEFFNALERKGIARFRQTPNAEYPYVVEILEGAKGTIRDHSSTESLSNQYTYLSRSDFGLGPHFYHATSKSAAETIFKQGMISGFLACEDYLRDALDYAQTIVDSGLESVVLRIELPEDWPLERVETGVYISPKIIVPDRISVYREL